MRAVKGGDRVRLKPQVFCRECHPCEHPLYSICNKSKVIGFQKNGTACDYYSLVQKFCDFS